MAMITSAEDWPYDAPLHDLKAAGLRSACKARMKLFSLDCALTLGKARQLSAKDRQAVQNAVDLVMGRS